MTHPNLFEKRCDESERLQDAKEALRAIRAARENYSNLLPVDQQKDEKLDEAQQLVQEVINRERGHIGVRLAAKYTRNPEYKHHELGEPGVLEEFEEWYPERQ